jgi:hypothetical protein
MEAMNQCDCAQTVPCPNDPPPPISDLVAKAWACKENCPGCDQSLDVFPMPCP